MCCESKYQIVRKNQMFWQHTAAFIVNNDVSEWVTFHMVANPFRCDIYINANIANTVTTSTPV